MHGMSMMQRISCPKVRNVNADAKNLPRKRTSWTYGSIPVPAMLPFLKEGSDQHRGWFQSSLLTAVATKGQAPYKTVLTHGYVVDGEGRKMSKSLGNGIDPEDVIKEYGADILRLWVASSDYRTDIRISKDILYILGNIYDFDPNKDMVSYDEMNELDKWALMKLNGLIKKVNDAYEKYEFHLMFHAIHNFCVVDMSNFYLDIIKDRLYTSRADSKERRSAQTAMYEILEALVKMLAPVLAFTSEEVWQFMPHRSTNDPESVQLNYWPEPNEKYENAALKEKWDRIIEIRDVVSKALEIEVTIFADKENYDFLLQFS